MGMPLACTRMGSPGEISPLQSRNENVIAMNRNKMQTWHGIMSDDGEGSRKINTETTASGVELGEASGAM